MTPAARAGVAATGAASRAPVRALALALALAVAAALAGCVNLAPLAAEPAGETISGRLALRVDATARDPARAVSAAFELRGRPQDGVLALTTPLGSTLGQARWRPGSVTLTTPRETRSYADLAEMTRDVLGESVPVEAWFDWLRGRPWPDAPSAAEAGGFAQLGWSVDVSALGVGGVVATRTSPPPRVTARVRLDTH